MSTYIDYEGPMYVYYRNKDTGEITEYIPDDRSMIMYDRNDGKGLRFGTCKNGGRVYFKKRLLKTQSGAAYSSKIWQTVFNVAGGPGIVNYNVMWLTESDMEKARQVFREEDDRRLQKMREQILKQMDRMQREAL